MVNARDILAQNLIKQAGSPGLGKFGSGIAAFLGTTQLLQGQREEREKKDRLASVIEGMDLSPLDRLAIEQNPEKALPMLAERQAIATKQTDLLDRFGIGTTPATPATPDTGFRGITKDQATAMLLDPKLAPMGQQILKDIEAKEKRVRETNIPGFTLDVGASPSADDAKNFKKLTTARQQLISQAERYKKAVGKFGTEASESTEGGRRLARIQSQLVTTYNKVAELGALAGADLELLTDITPTATGLRASLRSTPDVLQEADSFMDSVNDLVDSAGSALGFVPEVEREKRFQEFPDISELGGFGDQPDIGNAAAAQIATGFFLDPSEEGRMSIIKEVVPDAEFRDQNGVIIANIKGEDFFLNKPGASTQDFLTFASEIVKFAPAAKLTGFVKSALGFGATEVASQTGAKALGARDELDPTRVLMTAGFGGGFELLKKPAQAVMSRFSKTRKLNSKDAAILEAEGINPGAVLRAADEVASTPRVPPPPPPPPGAAPQLAQTTALTPTEQLIAKQLGSQNLARAATRLQRGEISTLADVAGEEVRGLTRIVAKKEGAKNVVFNFLTNRSRGATNRVHNLLSTKLTKNTDSFWNTSDEILATRESLSKSSYEAAVAKNPQVTHKSLPTLMGDARVQDAIKKGKARFLSDPNVADDSMAALQAAKFYLDDIAAGKDPNRSRVSGELSKRISDILEDVSPDFKKANKIYAGQSKLLEALELGKKYNTLRPQQIVAHRERMTAGEFDMFKIGVRENLSKTISTTKEGADPARRIFSSVEDRKKVRAVFGNDKEGFLSFGRRLIEETRAAETKHAVIGGSKSDFNMAADGKNLIDTLATVTKDGKEGLFRDAVDALALGIKGRFIGVNNKNAKEIAKILLDRDKGIEFLSKMNPPKNIPRAQKDIMKSIILTLPVILTTGQDAGV